MAHKKAGKTSKNGRDSVGQRLGVKASGGEEISAGSIIIRQHGSKFFPGENAGIGRDHTIFAKASGKVVFTGRFVSIQPA
ncbi:MAG: 50S ribosomal protein L27 [bacterium]